MMLKRFGTLALLAFCLFVMGMGEFEGCGEKPPPPPMEQLAGSYRLVDHEAVADGDVLDTASRGKLTLNADGKGWLVVVYYEDDASGGNSGPTWFATETTITYTDSDGDVFTGDYTFEENVLTWSYFKGDYATIETWRKL